MSFDTGARRADYNAIARYDDEIRESKRVLEQLRLERSVITREINSLRRQRIALVEAINADYQTLIDLDAILKRNIEAVQNVRRARR